MTVVPPARAMLAAVLTATLRQEGSELVATGRTRPSYLGLMSLLLPVLCLLGAVVIPDGRPYLTAFGLLVLLLIGREVRAERGRYERDVAALRRNLQTALDEGLR